MHSYIDTAKSLPETLKFYRRDVITMANRINLNGTSFHGAGAITEIVNEAQAHGFQKAFVCSDPDLVKFNVTSKVTDLLEKAGLAYQLYSDIKPNPTIDNVKHGVQAFKDSKADYIIAIGGGSSMDTAKQSVSSLPIRNLKMSEVWKELHRPKTHVYRSLRYQPQPEQQQKLRSTMLSPM